MAQGSIAETRHRTGERRIRSRKMNSKEFRFKMNSKEFRFKMNSKEFKFHRRVLNV